jgi:aryl-alcohol dehydrogenase-like predicted oxidoreductase
MQPITLGDTDLAVSPLCFGGNAIGSTLDDEAGGRLLDHFLSRGGNFIDTANMYSWWNKSAGAGSSESFLGRWTKARGNRDKVIIATKMGMDWPGGPDRGLTKQLIVSECDKSLRKLRTDYIDLHYAHADDRNTPIEETLRAFDSLVKAGKVRHIACSNFPTWRLAKSRCLSESLGLAKYVAIQQHMTYLRPKHGANWKHNAVATEELVDYCTAEPVTIVAYSPLLAGAYTRPERRWRISWSGGTHDSHYGGPDADARFGVLVEVAAELGVSANHVVLAWMLHHDRPIVPLFGATSMEQLDANLDGAALKLTDTQMQRLNQAGA